MEYNFVKQNHYQLITKNEAKFIFEQGEKQLKEQIDSSQQSSNRRNFLTWAKTLEKITFKINKKPNRN